MEPPYAEAMPVDQPAPALGPVLLPEDEPPVPFLSIYKLTGSNRTTRAQAEGVITLREEEDVIYAAQFYDCGWDCGLTENDLLMKNFQTIQTSWYS